MKTRIILLLLAVLALTGCQSSQRTVDVILQDDQLQISYQSVLLNGKTVDCEEFAGDPVECFEVDCTTLDHEIIDGEHRLRCEEALIYDQDQKVTEDEELRDILQKLCSVIDHDLVSLQIVIDKNRVFAYAHLNVNWSDPCELYEIADQAVRMCGWQNRKLIGMRVKI